MARQPSSSSPASRSAVVSLVVFAAIFVLTAHAQRQESRHQEQLDSFRSIAAAAAAAKDQPANVGKVLGAVLSERGFDDEDVQEILHALGTRLLFLNNPASFGAATAPASPTGAFSKRSPFQTGWKRIPTQARFAPFGTKLVPSRSRGESNGPTLLRYGRSQA